MTRTSGLTGALLFSLWSLAPALAADSGMVPEIRPGVLAGYLKASELPDSLALLPPPPALGSGAEMMDQEVARQALSMQGLPRFKLAAQDADLSFPAAAGAFACALGVGITEADTPNLYRLLRRVETDAGASTGAAKDKYQHARPFMLDGAPTCQPSAEKALRNNGSYPSGHTTMGWAWALVLAEVAPDRAEALLERGRAFGESRIVCNVHWATDVGAGRIVGAATVARLHGSAEFMADVQDARKDVEAARAKNVAPQRDCAAEAETLKATPWLAP